MSALARRIAIILAVAVIGVLAGRFVILPRLLPHPFSGAVITTEEKVPPTELLAGGGGTLRLTDFEGKVLVVYFGYTFCPDVCPAILSKLADALDILGDKADDVQVVMISVDPDRDTPEILGEYVTHFHPDFLAATSDVATVNRIATIFGVYYELQEGTESTGYIIDHTATVMLIDKKGNLKVVLPFEGTAEQMAADIAYFVG